MLCEGDRFLEMTTQKTVPLNLISDIHIQQYYFAVFELKLTKEANLAHVMGTKSAKRDKTE